MAIKINSINIQIDQLNNAHGGKEAAYFALETLLEQQATRTLENWDGARLRDINGNSIGFVSVDWQEVAEDAEEALELFKGTDDYIDFIGSGDFEQAERDIIASGADEEAAADAIELLKAEY